MTAWKLKGSFSVIGSALLVITLVFFIFYPVKDNTVSKQIEGLRSMPAESRAKASLNKIEGTTSLTIFALQGRSGNNGEVEELPKLEGINPNNNEIQHDDGLSSIDSPPEKILPVQSRPVTLPGRESMETWSVAQLSTKDKAYIRRAIANGEKFMKRGQAPTTVYYKSSGEVVEEETNKKNSDIE